jgi:hypothetical protein
MKRLFYLIFSLVSLLMITSGCGDNFLDQKNLTEQDESNFYTRPEKVKEAVTAIYASMSGQGSGDPITVACVLSPDNLPGGGPSDIATQGIDRFQLTQEDMYDQLWGRAYEGIFRANMLFMHKDDAKWDNEEDKNQVLGETHFLRAYFYFRLAKFFGEAPLITDPLADPNQPKASADELFTLIGSDLKAAINLMSNKPYEELEFGHASKWAAEALMARVFLFYTGVYNKSTLPTSEGEITKKDVQDWLVDMIDNSGFSLVTSDYRNLWPYSYDTTYYKYARVNDLKWVGEGPENPEFVFSIKFGPYAGWGDDQSILYCNNYPLFVGLRNNTNSVIGDGWGWATVNPQLWDSFEDNDTRQSGSILKIGNPEENPEYQDGIFKYGKNQYQDETGCYIKKYTPINGKDENGNWKGMYYLMYGGEDNKQLWNMQDLSIIRFSDVLLMAAELECPDAQNYFDEVRARAGLDSKPVTLENIKAERRHEFAFEGLRYFDLMRWHDLEKAFGEVKDIPIKNEGQDATYTAVYRPETNGFLPIPPTEIRLSGGVLVQNPGW